MSQETRPKSSWELRAEQAEAERDHERHEKETVADAAQAYARWSRAERERLRELLARAESYLRAVVSEDDGNGSFVRGVGVELVGFGAIMKRIRAALAGSPEGTKEKPMPILVDRDADLRIELRAWLDKQTITSDNIGDIRRSLFMPWDSLWNGWVRDDTATRENRRAYEGTQD